MQPPRPIAWEPPRLVLLDQTRLPLEERYLEVADLPTLAEAIRSLRVRGAPLIGVAAAYGLALAAQAPAVSREALLAEVEAAWATLRATRPTAVNLHWALDRMLARARSTRGDAAALRAALEAEAVAIHEEDRRMCAAIGAAGLPLVPDGALVLTHCNAGALATGGIGTALAPVYAAQAAGRRVAVLADETRPLLQGSRLTAWELHRAGIPVTLLADGMAASRLRRGDVTCVIVGADRIAANGDTANKIGTYGVALAARAHGVPFYVAAPRSTVDLSIPDGSRIPIEERTEGEVTAWQGVRSAPEGVPAWNPAFDVTPAALVTGFITDLGLLRPEELQARLRAAA